MNNLSENIRNTRFTGIAVMLLMALFVTACGGGGGGDGEPTQAAPPQSSGPGPTEKGGVLCELAAILFGGECIGIDNIPPCDDDPFNNPFGVGGPCTPSAPTNSTSGSGSSSGGSTWITPTVHGMDDTEPNNSISTPTQVSLNSRVQNGGRGGFFVDGMFNSSTDPADVFIFTLAAPANIEFSLCFTDSRCSTNPGNRIDVGTAYISVLDQFGDVIWSASNDPDTGNIQTFWLEAGVPYYLMLVAEDTMGSDLAYHLHVVEAQSQVRQLPPVIAVPMAPAIFDEPLLSEMTVTLDWLPPTEYSDGTPILDLAGYRFYASRAQGGPYNLLATLDVAGISSHMIDLPEFEDWYIVMTAVDAEGLESDFSNEVYVFIPPPPEWMDIDQG